MTISAMLYQENGRSGQYYQPSPELYLMRNEIIVTQVDIFFSPGANTRPNRDTIVEVKLPGELEERIFQVAKEDALLLIEKHEIHKELLNPATDGVVAHRTAHTFQLNQIRIHKKLEWSFKASLPENADEVRIPRSLADRIADVAKRIQESDNTKEALISELKQRGCFKFPALPETNHTAPEIVPEGLNFNLGTVIAALIAVKLLLR